METIIINVEPGKRPKKGRRMACAWIMLTLLVLASTITARVGLWSIAMAASRDGLPGGEITLPAYCILLVLFGYHARSWVDVVRKRLKGVTRMQYKVCPNCGAHLDHGERCDCQDPKSEPKRITVEGGRVAVVKPARTMTGGAVRAEAQ